MSLPPCLNGWRQRIGATQQVLPGPAYSCRAVTLYSLLTVWSCVLLLPRCDADVAASSSTARSSCPLAVPPLFWSRVYGTYDERRQNVSAGMDPTKNWVAFLRLPKTASTSMLHAIRDNFRPHCVDDLHHTTQADGFSGRFCVSQAPVSPSPRGRPARVWYRSCSQVIREHVSLQARHPEARPCKIYSQGHADFTDLTVPLANHSSAASDTPPGWQQQTDQQAVQGPWLLTILRDPVERTLSEFRQLWVGIKVPFMWDYLVPLELWQLRRVWQLTSNPTTKAEIARRAFDMWLASNTSVHWRNRQVRLLCGHAAGSAGPDAFANYAAAAAGDRLALDLAMEHLAAFTVVGLSDQYAVTRALLHYHTSPAFRPAAPLGQGAQGPPAVSSRLNTLDDLFPVDAALAVQLASLNKLDQILYRTACSQLQREVFKIAGS